MDDIISIESCDFRTGVIASVGPIRNSSAGDEYRYSRSIYFNNGDKGVYWHNDRLELAMLVKDDVCHYQKEIITKINHEDQNNPHVYDRIVKIYTSVSPHVLKSQEAFVRYNEFMRESREIAMQMMTFKYGSLSAADKKKLKNETLISDLKNLSAEAFSVMKSNYISEDYGVEEKKPLEEVDPELAKEVSKKEQELDS